MTLAPQSSAPQLGVALRDGVLTRIDQVECGLACQCACPACGARLLAKKGSIRQHHFAHYATHECEFAPETVAHLMAKEILAKTKTLTVPPVYSIPLTGFILHPYTAITFTEAALERRTGDIVPDLVLRSATNRELLVEIVVTHKASQDKIRKLVARGVSALEIYLPRERVISFQLIERALKTTASEKLWLYNAKAAEARRKEFGAAIDGSNHTYVPSKRYYAYFPKPSFSKSLFYYLPVQATRPETNS